MTGTRGHSVSKNTVAAVLSGTSQQQTLTLTLSQTREGDGLLDWLFDYTDIPEVESFLEQYEKEFAPGNTLQLEKIKELIVDQPMRLARLIAERGHGGQ